MAYPIRMQSQLGASESSPQQAHAALEAMKSGLRKWLATRRTMDQYVAGQRAPAGLLRNPGTRPLPPGVVAQTLRRDRFATEQDLAETLYALLVECGCSGGQIPQPNVSVDPDTAVKLAQLVLAGTTPTGPQAQGFVPWFILAIPVGGAVLIISQLIKSKADVAKHAEDIRCIESGACTDWGFWLKIASVSVIGWLAWDKLGLKERFKR